MISQEAIYSRVNNDNNCLIDALLNPNENFESVVVSDINSMRFTCIAINKRFI